MPFFIMTFMDPQLIEKSGKSFVEWKLEYEVTTKIDSIKLPEKTNLERLLGKKVQELRDHTEAKVENIRSQLKADYPAMMSEQLARVRDLDCECRKMWEQKFRNSIELKLTSLNTAKSKLIDFTQSKYMEIVQKLTLDVRIFLGVNATAFMFLLLLSFVKPAAIKHLFLPGTLMFISAVLCSYFYIFEQNWFYTIIYNDYTGYGYIAYLLIVFVFLCDIAFNKARVTTETINVLFQAVGHAVTLIPC